MTGTGKTVTRVDLCEAVYQKVGLSRTESSAFVELVLKEITDCLEKGETVKLSSFGSFMVRKKGQRIGRNPKTGTEVPISPRRVMVFKHAVGMITGVIVDAFEASGTNAEQVDWFVPHQANKRIIDASAHKLHIAPQKVVLTVDLHGNTSAASIPLALSVAVKDGRVKKGDLVLLEAMGGGFTWGSALLRW